MFILKIVIPLNVADTNSLIWYSLLTKHDYAGYGHGTWASCSTNPASGEVQTFTSASERGTCTV